MRTLRPEAVALFAALLPLQASAADIYINSPLVNVTGFSSSVAGAKYRLDNTNWDMAVHSGTGSNDPAPAPQDFVQAELGGFGTLNNLALNFTLEHKTGTNAGFVFTLAGGSVNSTLSWGAGLPGTNIATLQRFTGSGLDGIEHTPNDPFNFLLIEARAQRGVADIVPPEPDSLMTFSFNTFSGAGLNIVSGALVNGSTNENLPGSTWTPPGVGVENGRYWQFVYSNADLALFDWVLTGTVTGYANNINSPQESLRFEITAKNAVVGAVPVPAAVWLLGSALLTCAGLRRRTVRSQP